MKLYQSPFPVSDANRLSTIEPILLSIFPAKYFDGSTTWMVNLWRGQEIIHGEGPTLRDAIDAAIKLWETA